MIRWKLKIEDPATGITLSAKYYRTRREAVANADRCRRCKIIKGTWSQGLFAPECYFLMEPENRFKPAKADLVARLYGKRGLIKESKYPNSFKDDVLENLIPGEGETWELWREEPEGLELLYTKDQNIIRTYGL